jgi:hypothetical protein
MTRPDAYPHADRDPAEPTSPTSWAAVTEHRDRRRPDRARTVQVTCTIVRVVCGLFAVVLAARIVMVIGSANPANGVAAFVRAWSDGVSLGFGNLFTPANATARVVLNDGLAAVVWLGFGALVTTLIRRLALRGPAEVGRSF